MTSPYNLLWCEVGIPHEICNGTLPGRSELYDSVRLFGKSGCSHEDKVLDMLRMLFKKKCVCHIFLTSATRVKTLWELQFLITGSLTHDGFMIHYNNRFSIHIQECHIFLTSTTRVKTLWELQFLITGSLPHDNLMIHYNDRFSIHIHNCHISLTCTTGSQHCGDCSSLSLVLFHMIVL